MNYNGKWAAFAALGTALIGATGAWAQDAPPPIAEGAATAAPAPGRATKRPVSFYVEKWGKATGATVLADTATSKQVLAMPTTFDDVTGETLEPALTALMKRLPTGTTWAKIYLPAGRSLNADAVAEYALAQAHLFGGVGMPTPPGTIEVMGRKVSGEKADAVAAALELRPVYIVLNQNRASAGGAAGAASAEWATMTDEQKKAFAQKQAQDILAMEPKQQQRMMGQIMDQQRQVMQSLMQNMSPEQRQQFFQTMRQMMPFPGGGGRGGDPRRN